ncbi:uncharacterized protein LOC124208710 isoform X2 [Daphnia pulex]|nr:uncharacterized protein LOC124208710 isoform X2 [Daphnia pulex]
MEVEGAPDDPVEGSNVTLICTTSAYFHNVPPSWFYYDNGHHHQVTIKTDVQIKTEREWKDLIFYKSQLYLTNVTLKSPYTTLKCGYDTENSTIKEISFAIKEIDNDPVSNSITLEKGITQILSCNRLSQHVPIHWLKDGNQFSGTVDETETWSTLPLKGKSKEAGIYKCQWKNGRGEARNRNFNVTVTFVEEETNAMILSVTFIGLLAVGVGVGIKLYFDKTKAENQVEKILNPGEIDPNILIKTEFLSYDQIGEFTKKQLRLVLLFLDI